MRGGTRLTVELTTAYELSDDEAEQINPPRSSRRRPSRRATRTVDSALIGGIVLQAGSMRSMPACAAGSNGFVEN
jgi:F0F1-type ATP synthase delta subunit